MEAAETNNLDNHSVISNFLQVESSLTTLWRSEAVERPLDLSYKQISDIPESIVQRLKHYSTVVLSNTQISKFPKTLQDFTHIVTLDMSRCCMKELSPAIGNLVSLKYLILDHNELSFLPETIGKLTNLLELNVAYNNLRELPGTYGFLSSLKFLNISHNELTALPTEIGKLQNLEAIIATHNQIREVNPSIGSMSNLWSINLSHNPLERVPSTLIKIIPRLRMMEFDNTPLYDHVFNSAENKNRFASVAEYLFSLPADIIVSRSTFTRDMRNILNSPTFSDMKFKHGEQIYNGHRCVVSARLHRVRSDLLWHEPNITDVMKTKDCIITIKASVPTTVFEAVLAYLYVADVTNFEAIQEYIVGSPRGSEAEQMLSADLAALLKSGDFSDISFTVDSKEVKGHKCIISATCKTLSTFFTGEWKEARESTANLGGFSHEAVELLFEYLYAGDCEVTGENVMEMLAIADVFHIDRLKEQCEQLLVEGLDEENLLLIYEAAERHNAHQLIENCAYYASQHCSQEAFSKLPQQLHQVAQELKSRTTHMKRQVQIMSERGSVVHKSEAERIKEATYWSEAGKLRNSSEWGKLAGYNIKDPSEVLPSGQEETEKFLEHVLKKLNEEPVKQPTPKSTSWSPPHRSPKKKTANDFEYDFMATLWKGEQPNMAVLTLGGNAIEELALEPQEALVPGTSLNENPFKANEKDTSKGHGKRSSPSFNFGSVGTSPSPSGFTGFVGGITFNATNDIDASTSPSTTTSGFGPSLLDNASPSNTNTSPSTSPFTSGFTLGLSANNTNTSPMTTPFTGEFTLDAESNKSEHNTSPSTSVFVNGVTFNASTSDSDLSTSPATPVNAFGFTFGGLGPNRNNPNTTPSTTNAFSFSFSTSPSQSGLSPNSERTRSPHKSGRKSPKRDQEENEGIFGDLEKEKSMEQLLTKLNFNNE